ncbi:MAG: methyltransferase domain-containing protein, partial [Longimicrobiales bacterium]
AGLLTDTPGLSAIWHATARRAGGGAPALVAGAGELVEAWGDEQTRLGSGAFLQVNRSAAAELGAHVLALAGDVAGSHVIDAYCGVGLYARRFARAGARVTGIELHARAVDEARVGLAGFDAHIRQGRVEDELPGALPADLVVLNPPRAGLDERVPLALRGAPAARVIYVSCDPATLARDLARLGPEFEIRSVRCFDMFPQTAHVETVVELACATS